MMDKDNLLKLDNQLCFAIYACSKEVVRLYRPFLDALGITYTQYITLLALWDKDNLALKELGEKLFLDSGTLTPLLKKMEAAGLVCRQRSKDDERILCIRLTDKGKALKDDAYEVAQKVFCASQLSIKEAVDMRNQLRGMLARLTAAQEKEK
ncbi:MAG: transcriptional regulator, MarR family [Firmicutes bacterium]|nr:transcriptional regulator, MarR family [Bacillota bacterium]